MKVHTKKNDRIQFQCVIYQSQREFCQQSQRCHATRMAHTQPVNYRPEEQRSHRLVACGTRSTEVCYIKRAFPSVTGLLCLVRAVAYSPHQNISGEILLLIPHPAKVLLALLNARWSLLLSLPPSPPHPLPLIFTGEVPQGREVLDTWWCNNAPSRPTFTWSSHVLGHKWIPMILIWSDAGRDLQPTHLSYWHHTLLQPGTLIPTSKSQMGPLSLHSSLGIAAWAAFPRAGHICLFKKK